MVLTHLSKCSSPVDISIELQINFECQHTQQFESVRNTSCDLQGKSSLEQFLGAVNRNLHETELSL